MEIIGCKQPGVKRTKWIFSAISAISIASCDSAVEGSRRDAPDQVVEGIEVRTLCYGFGDELSPHYLPAGLTNPNLNLDLQAYQLFPRGTEGNLLQPALSGFSIDITPLANGQPVFRIIFISPRLGLCQHVLSTISGQDISIEPAPDRYRTTESNPAIAGVLSLIEQTVELCESSERRKYLACGDFNDPFASPQPPPPLESDFVGGAAVLQINADSRNYVITTFQEFINIGVRG